MDALISTPGPWNGWDYTQLLHNTDFLRFMQMDIVVKNTLLCLPW